MKANLATTAMLLVGLLPTAMATSYAPPQNQTLKSPNGQYTLVINADSGRHEVRKGDDVLWSFNSVVDQHSFYLSNDGQCVLWAAWKYVQSPDGLDKEAVVVYSAEGVRMKKTFLEISNPRRYRDREVGPIGDFWRIWRSEITQDGDVISIAVEGREGAFKVDLSHGEPGEAIP